jgi:hypothetical protein
MESILGFFIEYFLHAKFKIKKKTYNVLIE